MKIVALNAENIKRIVTVEIKPDGNLVQITGKNGNGKTSVLDSIWWALDGAKNIQAAPIHKGATHGRIRLDLGEIIVTRTFKNGKSGQTSSISVTSADGAKFPSPQAMLDGLLSSLAFDPLAFSRMGPKDQFDTLKKFVPDVDFNAIDEANRRDFVERADINRSAKDLKSAIEVLKVDVNGPTELVVEKDLVDQLEAAAQKNADRGTREANRKRMADEANDQMNKANALIIESVKLKEASEKTQKKLDGAGQLADIIDVSEIREKINKAKATNENVAAIARQKAMVEKFEKYEAQAKELTSAMEVREIEKRKKVAKAKLPVRGLSFGDNAILLNELPFDQASDAEQLQTSVSMAMALNPKLKVIRVRDGSLLDEDALKLLSEMADTNDYQVWIERVDGSGKVGFVLEDGMIKGAKPAAAATEKKKETVPAEEKVEKVWPDAEGRSSGPHQRDPEPGAASQEDMI